MAPERCNRKKVLMMPQGTNYWPCSQGGGDDIQFLFCRPH